MTSEIATTQISLSRTIDASPEAVFEAWLDRTCPGSPWHGVTRAIVPEPAVDALFYSMYTLEGREIAHYGRFIALDRPQRIQHTWVSEATRGLESMVTLTLTREPVAGKTKVQVQHTNLPDDENGRRHEHAWGYVLGLMRSRFGKKGRESS